VFSLAALRRPVPCRSCRRVPDVPAEVAKVVIVQAAIRAYRVGFFARLADDLSTHGIRLVVLYGAPTAAEQRRGDIVSLPSPTGRALRSRWLLRGRLLYLPIWDEVRDADLIIVEQANKHLVNIPLLLASRLGLKRVAYWGHGRNRQGRDGPLAAWIKRGALRAVDWWFAYTEGTARYLQAQGMSPARITTVQNSSDTNAFQGLLADVGETEVSDLRARLGFPADARVALYCGGLYPDKRLESLLTAAGYLRQHEPNLRLVIIGDGVQRELIERAAQTRDWLHYAGPCFGRDKAGYFRLAEIFLHPGAIGLAVLDAFAAGLPVMTMDLPTHGPEIEYLTDGVQGLVTAAEPKAYAAAVAAVLADRGRLQTMQQQARTAAARYSAAVMAANMRQGILACLNRAEGTAGAG
jgi:glycosyltransferase involved in cell wall biosynthesis